MVSEKRAAIDIDEVGEKQLGEISAADFLQALDAGDLSITLWPEKKKVEYWPEPENWEPVRVIDILDVLRKEKKKLELEKYPGFERVIDPLGNIPYERLLDRVVRDVEDKLGGRVSSTDPDVDPVLVDRLARDVARRLRGGG